MTKIAVITGTTRPGRVNLDVAQWVLEQASRRSDAEFELVDIADWNLPLLDEAMPAGFQQYANPHTHSWSAKIAEFDGYIFVTPEYNHSISGSSRTPLTTSPSSGTTKPPASCHTAPWAAPAPSSTSGASPRSCRWRMYATK